MDGYTVQEYFNQFLDYAAARNLEAFTGLNNKKSLTGIKLKEIYSRD